tara:strand:- start:20704 stop:22407 length:1704 start_codon:yes stop_codon:yes gene_type:complete
MVITVLPLTLLGSSPGEIPFDWSGQWGTSHSYGFSSWGIGFHRSPLHFDGNFVEWPNRFRFSSPAVRDGMSEDGSLSTSINYRKGDYGLDELSLDFLSHLSPNRTTRFRAFKRNFEDYHGIFDPMDRPGGTVQQNYRFDSESSGGRGDKWQIATALFLTTGGVPRWNMQWERGAERRDKILTAGASYSGKTGSMKYRLEGSSFLEQFRNRKMVEEITVWSADLYSHRIHALGELPVQKGFSFFFSGTGRSAAVSSDTLGNQWQSYLGAAAGLRIHSSSLENRAAIGASRVSSGETAITAQGHFRLKGREKSLFLTFKRDLQLLPLQFTSRAFMYARDSFSHIAYPRVRPDSTARVPTRTVFRAGASAAGGDRVAGELTLFVSQISPHHYFEKIVQSDGLHVLGLNSERTSRARGIIWKGSVNYFRDWTILAQGKSMLDGQPGWGYLFRHDNRVELRFHEKLFWGRLDAGVNLSAHYWSGRTAYDWDPILNMGFTETGPRDVQESVGILSAEFKAVIQSVELSYVMTNLQYLIERASGEIVAHTFSPSPLFPPAGRLVYFKVGWYFSN